MATKIVLTVEEGLSVQDASDLRVLFKDAFGEFAVRRFPADDYVERRYPGTDVYGGQRRIDKIAQVRRRTLLAKTLCTAADELVVCDVDAGLSHDTLEKMAASNERVQACVLLLQDLFGMESEEARATFNQLEDKRITKLMIEQGLVKS